MLDAVIVGAGPNGLAAAVELASRGLSVHVFEAASTVGGGARTKELIAPGHWHDVCAAVHPFAIASPLFRRLPLDDYGLEWVHPDVPLSHPLGGGEAIGLLPDVAATARLLGRDAAVYDKTMSWLIRRFDDVLDGAMAPLQAAWRHPVTMGRFGVSGIRSVKSLVSRFETDAARALFAGLGAHSIADLSSPATGAIALLLGGAAHASGWPIVRSGSQSIVDSLAAYLGDLGGNITTGHTVSDLGSLPEARMVFLDTSPGAAARIGRDRVDKRVLRRLQKWRHGPGSFKLDWILDRPIPGEDDLSPRAGTVHVGGTYEEIAASEAAAARGETSARPFVLVAQPSLFDPTRAPSGKHVAWGYCHVPHGSSDDATAAIESQIERFAPGFGDAISGRHVHTPQALETYNANYVGGDIGGGELRLGQLLRRPRIGRNPYKIGDGLFLCSSSTAPGAGVHGMCGSNAARYALGVW